MFSQNIWNLSSATDGLSRRIQLHAVAACSPNLIRHGYCVGDELYDSNDEVGFLGDGNQLIVFHRVLLSLPEPRPDLISLLHKNQEPISPPTLPTYKRN